jgi:site-specific recombinase XerD
MDDQARSELMVVVPGAASPIPAFAAGQVPGDLRAALAQAVEAWLMRTPLTHIRKAYRHDLGQFLAHAGIDAEAVEKLPQVQPHLVTAWRVRLAVGGLTNSSIRRKLTVLRSLFSFLKTYGYHGANPAHGDFVAAPAVSRDGKTVGLSPSDCRRLLNAPSDDPAKQTPVVCRDRALLAVLAYSGCRVGELVRLKLRDFKTSGEHRILLACLSPILGMAALAVLSVAIEAADNPR